MTHAVELQTVIEQPVRVLRKKCALKVKDLSNSPLY